MTTEELHAYFTGIDLPKTMILYPGVRILNVRSCVKSHLEVLSAKGELNTYSGFLDRLLQIKNVLEKDH